MFMKLLGQGWEEYKTAFKDGRLKGMDSIAIIYEDKSVKRYFAVTEFTLGDGGDGESTSAESEIKDRDWICDI